MFNIQINGANNLRFSGALRLFNPNQFKEYKNQLENIIKKEDAFCLYCYLFRQVISN